MLHWASPGFSGLQWGCFNETMSHARFWRTTVRLAWRNLRYSRTRTGFIVAALAAGIATVAGVHGASEVGREALRGDSRAWLAGDLALDTRDPITQDQAAGLDRTRPGGTAWTLMTTSLTMARSGESADSGVIQVKAIDPNVYPFYGAISLDPPQSLDHAVGNDRVAVSEEVFDRLAVRIGDSIAIAGRPFVISAVITGEPDRFSNEVGIGMRCLMSRLDYERSGLDESATSVKNRVLLRLPAAANPASARRFLQALFPSGNLRDAQSTHRHEAEITENVAAFLSVTAFLAIALGSLGAAIAMRQHTEERLPTLAILKTLGARTSQLVATVVAEIGAMMIGALAAGIPLGFLLQRTLLSLGGKYLVLPPVSRWNRMTVVESACVTLLAMTPILAQPLMWIRYLRPAIVLRRAMWASGSERVAKLIGERTAERGGENGIRRTALPARAPYLLPGAAALLSGAAFLAIANWMLHSWKSALLLFLAIAATVLVTMLLASASLYLLRRLMRDWLPAGVLPVALRYGIASVYRPGNRAGILVAALAASLILMIATFESRGAVVESVLGLLPSDRSDLYLAGFRSSQRSGIEAFIRGLPGVEHVDFVSQVRVEVRDASAQDPPAIREILRQSRGQIGGKLGESAAQIPVRRDGVCDPGYVLHSPDGVTEICIDSAAAQALAGPPRSHHGASRNLRSRLLRSSDGVNTLTGDEWNYYYSGVSGVSKPAAVFPAVNRMQRMTVDDYLERLADVLSGGGTSYLAMCDPGLANPSTQIAQEAKHRDAVDVRLSLELADELGAKVGTHLTIDVRDSSLTGRVSEIADFTPALKVWFRFSMDCSALDPETLYHQAGIQVRPGDIPAVVRAIRSNYPALAVITAKEISQTVDSLTSDAVTLARRVAWCAMVGGLLVLIAIVAASRGGRLSEVAILSTLGAPRSMVLRIYCTEFAVIGFLSAAIASLLAWGLTGAAFQVIFHHFENRVPWTGIGGAMLLGAAAAVAGGWLPTFGVLSRKPLEVLRGE
jgi:predicted lysophospholipase L1 biosynthesis ABC-type transport system permease subunit